jgi:hypothetical protein
MFTGDIVHNWHELHENYGDVVRMAPDWASIIKPEAWRGELSAVKNMLHLCFIARCNRLLANAAMIDIYGLQPRSRSRKDKDVYFIHVRDNIASINGTQFHRGSIKLFADPLQVPMTPTTHASVDCSITLSPTVLSETKKAS